MRKLFLILNGFMFMTLTGMTAMAADGKYIELMPRTGVVLPIYVIRPDKPAAAVVLLPGGKGVIKLGADGPEKGNNFLVRSRDLFAENNLLVAVVDAPIEAEVQGSLEGTRTTQEHATDISAVVSYLRTQAKVPVWVVGTSRGTISAANLAARLPEAADGIVLTSSVSESGKKRPDSVMKTDLASIKVPVLLVHHRKDSCYVSPYGAMEKIKKQLTNAKLVETISFSGGKQKQDNGCKPKTYHGYFKIEDEVVKSISDWIKAH